MSWGVTRFGATVFCEIGRQPGLKVIVPGAFGTFAEFIPDPKVNDKYGRAGGDGLFAVLLFPHTGVDPCMMETVPVGTTEPAPTTVTR
jgi:hypothetical protein